MSVVRLRSCSTETATPSYAATIFGTGAARGALARAGEPAESADPVQLRSFASRCARRAAQWVLVRRTSGRICRNHSLQETSGDRVAGL
jgi:hypothetical protein